MLFGTEADIINCVARLRLATKDQIRKEVGFSLDYIGFLCRYLVRKDYLRLNKGRFSLAEERIKTLLVDPHTKDFGVGVNRKLLKKVAKEVAKGISDELKQTVRGMKTPLGEIKYKTKGVKEEPIKIKTDFEIPVRDETLALESNIGKVGAKLEEEESDIKDKINLLKKLQKRREKDERRKN